MGRDISEEKELKNRVGKLGVYLVQKADKEIREMNQLVLFQKAKIKKKNLEKTKERSQQIKNTFIDTYNEFCNNSLSSNLIRTKDYSLNLKNRLNNELNEDIRAKVNEHIQKNYSEYIKFMIKNMEESVKDLKGESSLEYHFNSKDYDYFTQNKKQHEDLFGEKVQLRKLEEGLIGGYRIILPAEKIARDYSIDEIINNNSSLIEKEFLKLISEEEMKKIEHEFAVFIQTQKSKIEEYLREYDQI